MEQAVKPKSTKSKISQKEKKVKKIEAKNTTPELTEIVDKHLTLVSKTSTENEEDSEKSIGNGVDHSEHHELSSVVPGHFYKLCTTKSDQSGLEKDMESFAINKQRLDYGTEPSAPEQEYYSLENALSPTAPALSLTPLNSNEFSLDPALEDEALNEEVNKEQDSDDVLLPLNEDDWELGAIETQVESIYPELISDESSNLEPFNRDQLSMFYHNVLLEHIDSYIEQFLTDANDYDDKFKMLLRDYYQARQQLIEVKQKRKKYQETVSTCTEKVFITTRGKVDAEAICQDKRKVSTVHHYDVCRYNAEAGSRLGLVLREDRRIASEEVTVACYTSTVARLHCEQYLFEATEKYNRHRTRLHETSENLTGSVRSSILLQLIDESIRELKSVANVLFLFVRKRRCKDDESDRFWTDLEKWIAHIILHLLQSSDCATAPGRHFSEEMFLLNHLLRCPPGLHRWAAGLVQVSGPSFARDGKKDQTALDHCICLLRLVLTIPRDRHNFLTELGNGHSFPVADDKSESWTLIDDDGDEIETSSSDISPLEGDLIVVFSQIPLEGLLSSILELLKSPENLYYYSEKRTSSEDVMTTFATCDLICDILGEGLSTFGRPKYKQLVRRVAQTLRNVVLIVSQHWQRYRLAVERDPTPQLYSNERLQLEFDEFYKRCVSRLLAVAKLGIYQFVADLSYHFVSSRAAETLYLLMNVPPGVRSEVDTLISEGYTKQEWLDFIQDPDTKLAFEEHLSTMPANEIIYLLTTFANLAQARPSNESHLINTIITDIFKVSFVYKSTRDVCSKTGRELLSSVATYHPFIISTLLRYIEDNMDIVSSIAVYALSDLPFATWQPTPDDVSIFRTWILTNPVGSPECKLAQIVMQGLNFKMNTKSETPYIPFAIHQKLAVLLVEANVRINLQQAGLMMKSIDHVSKVASAVRLASHPVHQQFVAWSWKILFKLKLHQPAQQLTQTSKEGKGAKKSSSSSVPDISAESHFLPVLHAAKQQHPAGCYVATMIGAAGHRKEAFLQDGLEFIHALATSGNIRALLYIFDATMPMFYGSNVNLGQNQRFCDVLTRFLHATDEGIISGVASYLLTDGKAQETSVSLLTSVIENHVAKATRDDGENAVVLSYWLEVILAIPSWYKDNHMRCLVDYIFKSSLLIGEKCLLDCRVQLYENYVSMVLHGNHDNASRPSKGMMTSLIQMVSGGNHEWPSFINVIASSENIYFKYEALLVETRYEDDSSLWSTMLSSLRADLRSSLESAMKKSSTKLKLSRPPPHANLALYRWAELALHTPHSHPLLPLVWYNFFLRYIYLPTDGSNSFGCRFFEPVSMLPLYNKLRLRLQTSMEHHHGFISSKSSSADGARQHELLVKLYQCYKLWLEEPKMHECNLYLPSLPSQYNSKLLALVRTRNAKACDDVVDRPSVKRELVALKEKWIELNIDKPKRRLHTRQSYHHQQNSNDSQERINHLLKQLDCPLPIPPAITSARWSPPVSIGNPSSLHRYETVLSEIDQDLKVISSFADRFSRDEAKQHQINNDYLNLLPHLYYMKATELNVTIECQSAFSSTHKCSGGAVVDLRFKQKTLDQSVREKLQANRNLFQREIEDFTDEAILEELSYSSLHLKSVMRALESNLRNPTHSEELQRQASDAGIRLFYLLADMYSGERVKCLPTRKLLGAAVEMIGQKFVSQSSDEALHILEQVISNPSSATLLSPHFAPGCKSRHSPEHDVKGYLQMYQKVVKLVSTTKDENPDVLFVLLTKFEMGSWLISFHPPLMDRIELLHNIMIGMISCNNKAANKSTDSDRSSPVQADNVVVHKSSHTSVHEVYTSHYKALLSHNFPDMFDEALRYLLEASRTQEVGISTWHAFLEVSFPDPFLSAVDPSRKCSYSSAMDFNTLQGSIEHMVAFFTEQRNQSAESRSCGLYASWKPYAMVISELYANLCNTYLSFICADRLPLLYTETRLTSDPEWSSVNTAYELFNPWLQPYIFDAEIGEIGWPWRDGDGDVAEYFVTSFTHVICEFCQRDNLPVPAFLARVWSSYAEALLHEKRSVPFYMFKAYHAMMTSLPWERFIPHLSAFDQMIQFSDGRDSHPIHFLCYLVPKLSWTTIINACRNVTTDHNQSDEWNPVTCEVLCRLLHLLISLGSNAARLEKYNDLKQLFDDVEQLPWRCVRTDPLDYLCHLACERYSWTSPLLYQSVKSQSRDPRCCVFRLLKVVCGLPLTGEEKGKTRSATYLLPSDCVPSDWLKMQSFIKTVGQLLQKIRNDDKSLLKTASAPLNRYVERTYESIEMTSCFHGAAEQLPDLLSSLFNYLNILASSLQPVVRDSMRSIVARKAACQACTVQRKSPHKCQDCVYLKSRALSSVTLLASITSVCDVVSTPYNACVLIDDLVTSYLHMTVVDSKGISTEIVNSRWKDVLSVYRKPVANKEEYIKHSLQSGSLLSLYIFALDMVELVDFHANISFVKNDLPDDARLEKLYEVAVLDVHWLSTVVPTREIECKIMLLWDHFICVCAVLFKVASLSPIQGFTVHSIIDTVAGLLPTLEQVGLDKVKTGLLGSIGIGTQSPLSIEFRVTAKAILVYLKNWIAKADSSGTNVVTLAQNSFEAFENLPTTNKMYLPLQPTIAKACSYVAAKDVTLECFRDFLSLFVKQYFQREKYLSHLAMID